MQSATGILSGSVYNGVPAFARKLHGEMEPWRSGRTTLIKNHENHGIRSEICQNDYFSYFLIILLLSSKSQLWLSS